jgi:hypothetical protein
MMKAKNIERDERTLVVENASYKVGFQVLAYGLLVLVMIRSYFFNQSSWDLLGLAVFGGLAATAYQAYHRILSRRMVWGLLVLMILSAGVAALVVLLLNN